jgi:hypothetical protein
LLIHCAKLAALQGAAFVAVVYGSSRFIDAEQFFRIEKRAIGCSVVSRSKCLAHYLQPAVTLQNAVSATPRKTCSGGTPPPITPAAGTRRRQRLPAAASPWMRMLRHQAATWLRCHDP